VSLPSFRSAPFNVAGALILVVTASGCVRIPHQSVSRLWDRVRWNAPDESAERNDSPTVTANVARITTPGNEPERSPPGEQPASVAANDAVPPTIRNVSESDAPTPDPFAEASPVSPNRRIRELKAALSADAEQEAAEPPGMAGSQSLRLRVDGLLRRANELLRVGQLRDARRTAQLAAELSDSAALEFLPTEDRPNDVLREIEDRLQAQLSAMPAGTADSANRPATTADTRPAADVEGAAEPQALGKVVANGPYVLRDPHESSRLPDAVPEDILTMPALPVLTDDAWKGSANERPLLASLPWKEPATDAASAGTGWTDPLPPTIHAIAPLTTFRARQAAASRSAADPPERVASPWFTWSDGLALVLLALLLSGVGAALQIRRWRFG
jgi:hypothetical protein